MYTHTYTLVYNIVPEITKVRIHRKMPLNILWTIPVNIHWTAPSRTWSRSTRQAMPPKLGPILR